MFGPLHILLFKFFSLTALYIKKITSVKKYMNILVQIGKIQFFSFHFWFITLHPFDDGNGRITRALTDLALGQAYSNSTRLLSLSLSILNHRKGYYEVLERCQKSDMDVSEWVLWFLGSVLNSIEYSEQQIERSVFKTRFWKQHVRDALSAEQIKVLNRLLDGGEKGFELGISASQYQKVAKVSKATATRHLSDLVKRECLQKLPGGGRSTRYHIKGWVV